MNVGHICSLARYTFLGNIRNRIFLVLILFGGVLLSASVLLSILGQEQAIRILTDLGLASIEILALFTAIFLIVNLILEQIEQRTIYLVLTRAISRLDYLLGSYLGTLAAIFVCVAIMTLIHLGILFLNGWKIQQDGVMYFTSVFMSFEKIVLISALGLFFSLYSSSAVAALVFTFFFWTLGHFAVELKFLAEKIQNGALKAFFKFIYYLIPHLQYMNARDLWISYQDRFTALSLQGTLYTVLYSAVALSLAYAAFRKKEF